MTLSAVPASLPVPSRIQDLTGQTYDRWTVLGFAGYKPLGRRQKQRPTWWCRCTCGTLRQVTADSLRDHRSHSCGCLNQEAASQRWRTHGETNSPVYRAWMLLRHHHADMDPLWARDYLAFREAMGPRPPGASLRRHRQTQPHGPGNTYWGLPRPSRPRQERQVHWQGLSLPVTAWAARQPELGLTAPEICRRLDEGWTPEEALTLPLGSPGWRQAVQAPPPPRPLPLAMAPVGRRGPAPATSRAGR